MFGSLIRRFKGTGESVALREALARQKRISNEYAREIRRLRHSGAVGGSFQGGDLERRVVWIFGGGRSGTTWMANMMRDMSRQEVWFEPNVGEMLDPYKLRYDRRRRTKNFIFSEELREVWRENIRSLILDGIEARFPELPRDSNLMIKEPGGSIGAKLLAESLPESRVVLLVRDPRDVISSWKDSMEEGGWNHERITRKGDNPATFSVVARAQVYQKILTQSLAAYESHKAPRTIVKYENLVADPVGEMSRMYSEIGVSVDGPELTSVVEKHSWGNIPEEEKGQGKFYRKGASGGWKEDLTEGEAKAIEKVNAPIMDALGYEHSS